MRVHINIFWLLTDKQIDRPLMHTTDYYGLCGSEEILIVQLRSIATQKTSTQLMIGQVKKLMQSILI